ncbi:protein PTST homolog 3, chloroplastic isoform X4 [Diospyros lotus]|uniref:protein PTST homolog 3, chloroplastic isoform X4 n=1 Tax=Diospyros lotus TaxID=55363 RepID=UPI0022569699|nr:protein PTST homolog 3, chloroplastic isoform X4 [Diospyros lotus]
MSALPLSRFPAFSYLSSHKLCALPLPSVTADHALLHRRRLPTISASSIRKPRASRKVRNDADLCTDIQEFLRVVGLPEGHVPSVKELSQHGRQDLANIVRRRGYKFMKELLVASTESGRQGSDAEEGLIDKKDISGEHKLESTVTLYSTKGQDENVEDMAAEMLLTSEVPVKQNHLNSADGANINHALISESESCTNTESSSNLSLQEKVAKFIQDGELDAIEDAGDDKDFFELEDATKESCSLGKEHSELVLNQSHNGVILNESVLPTMQVVLAESESNAPRNDQSSSEGPLSAGCDEQLDVETSKRENQIEVNHLELHQKELELSQLKEQIEKEKLALSVVQTKAETEISKAKKLILEKDAELQAVEESLSGLEEVQIHYEGEGETVEVAGSFNGWQHRITMDPQLSSSILDPIGSRNSRLWTATLWLYPGKYEIKFIVDGQWRIDPQKESVTRGKQQWSVRRSILF